ncbi:MAG: trypsin-like serine protease [Myxococcaceae bacterium]
MRVSRWVVACVALASSCGRLEAPPSTSTQQPIVGGSEDAGYPIDDVFLVAMTFDNGVNTICSGTLIGAHSIVTAAHCVDPARQGANSVTIKVTHKPTDMMLLSSDLFDVTDYRLHPSWVATSNTATYDIAMLLLAVSPPGVTPREINRDPLTNFAGEPIKLVGYGRTQPSMQDSGIRRSADATVNSVATETFDFGTAGTLGICSGDSGGPALHTFPDGVERIIGVHSQTSSPNCGVGTDTRIDFHLAFIDQWFVDKEPVDAGVPDAGPPDAGPPDAGVPDAGAPDAGEPDAGAPDAGEPDAGVPDAGPGDSGVVNPGDAGTPDAGQPDAGQPDAGLPDAGPVDAGPVDAGTIDAGAPDGGTGGDTPVTGCGCSSAPSPLFLLLLLLLRALSGARARSAQT